MSLLNSLHWQARQLAVVDYEIEDLVQVRKLRQGEGQLHHMGRRRWAQRHDRLQPKAQ